ncbi:MAG: helix-turn-helix domain-containing protein [Clostridia bacterium]|nr:helix-turn-helix domain-containing protein [Clostridia bacterium]
MPGRPWTDSSEYLKQRSSQPAIILITAYRDFEYAKTAVNHHVDYLINKPFKSSALIDAVTAICEKIRKSVNSDIEASKKLLKNWEILRSSFLDVYNSDTPDGKYTENFFETVKGRELSSYKCYELEYTAGDDALINENTERMSIDLGEYDSDGLSVLYIKAFKQKIIFVALSTMPMPQNIGDDFIKAVLLHTGIQLTLCITEFQNFEIFKKQKCFNNISEKVYFYISQDKLNLAHAYLKTVSGGLCLEDIRELLIFLPRFLQSKKLVLDIKEQLSDTEDITELKKQLSDIPYSLENKTSDSLIITKAAGFIKQNYSDCNLSLQTVAEALSISESHLGKLFKKELSVNFSGYLLNVRMERAKQLLRNTDLSVAEICHRVGYNYPTYFRKIFNNHTGMSPSEYRNKN